MATNPLPRPKTANELLMDALIRHQIYVLRVSGSIRNKVVDLLNSTEADLSDRIRSRLLNHPGMTPGGVRRLESLLKNIKELRGRAWEKAGTLWQEDLLDLAKAEPTTVAGLVKTVSPVALELSLPAASLLRTVVTSRPFEGRVLKQWAKSVADSDIKRISDQIRIGVVQGESSAEIARRVVGTVSLSGTNGVTELSRQQAAAITRTAVNHVTNEARAAFFAENTDIFSEEIFVATLDSRTTPVCRANDGKVFPIGEGPKPPLHFGCRSLRVPSIDGGRIGDRPARNFTEKQLLREFASKEGLGKVASRATLPRGTKSSFDAFARRRKNELTGQVPSKTTYQEWLGGQSKQFQEDILGVSKAKLFRDGGLTLDKFVNRAGDELPLTQLAKTHKDAFKAAGLDPENFLD